MLVIGNLLSATACVTAICLVRLYRGGPPGAGGSNPAPVMSPRPVTSGIPVVAALATAPVPVAPPPAFAHAVTDMRTQEFVLLRDAVLAEHRRRTGERRLALA